MDACVRVGSVWVKSRRDEKEGGGKLRSGLDERDREAKGDGSQ